MTQEGFLVGTEKKGKILVNGRKDGVCSGILVKVIEDVLHCCVSLSFFSHVKLKLDGYRLNFCRHL